MGVTLSYHHHLNMMSRRYVEGGGGGGQTTCHHGRRQKGNETQGPVAGDGGEGRAGEHASGCCRL